MDTTEQVNRKRCLQTALDLSDPATTTDLKVEHRTNHLVTTIKAIALDLDSVYVQCTWYAIH